jgi:predicted metallopeptidase
MRYEKAPEIEDLAYDIARTLDMKNIVSSRVIGMRSFGSKGRAIARIWSFPKIWQAALELSGPFYVIEVIHERYDSLDSKEKAKTIIHELLHIPQSFGGGLLGHGQAKINRITEERLYAEYFKRKTSGQGSDAEED